MFTKPARTRRRRNIAVTTFAVIALITGGMVGANVATAQGMQIMVSASADRTSPVPLDNKSLKGPLYVFVEASTGVDGVSFFLDGQEHYSEVETPFDFMGASPTGAYPFKTDFLADGMHVIEAVVTGAQSTTLTANFETLNGSTQTQPLSSPVVDAARSGTSVAPEPTTDPTTAAPSPDVTDTTDTDPAASAAPTAQAPLTPGDIGTVVWTGDFETGDLSQYGMNGYEQVRDPEIVSTAPYVREGNHAAKFTLSSGEGRTEILPSGGPDFTEGDDYTFGFSTYLEEGFPMDVDWQLIVQWKNDGTGSPPLDLGVNGGEYIMNGHLAPDSAGETPGKAFTESIAPATTGEWVDWEIRVLFSSGNGQVNVSMNGAPVHQFTPSGGGGTLYPGLDSYLKIGYYRSEGISETGTVYFDNWRIGQN